jgi:arylsulfatase A-like enzyme
MRTVRFYPLLLVLITGCSQPVRPVDNVVLISIDSLRADHVGAYGYGPATTPTIDSLAKGGARFDRAYSTTSWTLPAHASLLSGLFNESHGATDSDRTITPGVMLLAEALSGVGIRSSGIFSGPYLDPSFGFGRGFDSYASAASYSWAGSEGRSAAAHGESHEDVTNPRIKTRLQEWLATPRTDRRNFLFIHMWDVHYDYLAPDRYVRMFDPDYRGSFDASNFQLNKAINRSMDKRDYEHLLALYDAEIRFTDDTIADLLALLKKAGLLENTAVIVTSDHGDEFLDHGGRGHMSTLYEEVLHVPLIMRVFGRSSPRDVVISTVVSLVDIFPTVCALFAVDCHYDGPGQSLAVSGPDRPNEAPRNSALAQLSVAKPFKLNVSAIVRPQDKLIVWKRSLFMNYFRFPGDRLEQHPFLMTPTTPLFPPLELESSIATMERLSKDADELGRKLAGTTPALPPLLGDDAKEQLRSLGYIQ